MQCWYLGWGAVMAGQTVLGAVQLHVVECGTCAVCGVVQGRVVVRYSSMWWWCSVWCITVPCRGGCSVWWWWWNVVPSLQHKARLAGGRQRGDGGGITLTWLIGYCPTANTAGLANWPIGTTLTWLIGKCTHCQYCWVGLEYNQS